LGMRMTPKQYFAIHEEASPSLFCEAGGGREVVPLCHEGRHAVGWVINPPYIPELPSHTDHTAIIIGLVAVVAVVGLVVLGLAYFSRKG